MVTPIIGTRNTPSRISYEQTYNHSSMMNILCKIAKFSLVTILEVTHSSRKITKTDILIADLASKNLNLSLLMISKILQTKLTTLLKAKDFSMSKAPTTHVWKAHQYHNHSSAQKSAALMLLDSLSLTGSECILDVGCGDGKITKTISDRISSGTVTGLDISPEMIAFAREKFPHHLNNNLFFVNSNGENFLFENLDLVFSSFAIQWMPNKDAFFKSAYRSLKSGAQLAATIPLGISEALECSIRETTSLSKWASYFREFSPGWHFVDSDEYMKLLRSNRFSPLKFDVITQDVLFPTRKDFENYVLQWFSYLRPLPQPMKEVFFKEVMDRYLTLEPPIESGEIRLRFKRLDLIAQKI